MREFWTIPRWVYPRIKQEIEPAQESERSLMTHGISSGQDVITFLRGQHDQIKGLFSHVKSTSGAEREEAFTALRRLLAVHETAEEEIVHPRARKAIADGDIVIGARLNEEHKVKQTLSQLEELDVDSPQFVKLFTQLKTDVEAHAEAEEHQEFSKLADVLDQDGLEKMRTAVERAEKLAPTRPYPGVESAAANLLAGPFAAMIDRARDALAGKST
jgi:hemerythrin superfamily protein